LAEVNVEVIERFKKLPTAVVSDALDRLGIAGARLGIKPIIPGVKAVGPAYTVKYSPSFSALLHTLPHDFEVGRRNTRRNLSVRGGRM